MVPQLRADVLVTPGGDKPLPGRKGVAHRSTSSKFHFVWCAKLVGKSVLRNTSCVFWLLMVCGALFSFGSGSGPIAHITDMLGSTAAVTNSTGRMITSGLNAAADLTDAAASTIAGLKSGSLDVAKEAWHGVDIVNVSCSMEHGKLAADDARELNHWLKSRAGLRATRVPLPIVESLCVLVDGITIGRPHLGRSQQLLEYKAGYLEARLEARLLPSGFLAVQWQFKQVQYQLTWANPLWEMLEFDVAQERSAIAAHVFAALRDLTAVDLWVELTDSSVGTANLPRLLHARLQRAGRWGFVWIKSSINAVLDGVVTPY